MNQIFYFKRINISSWAYILIVLLGFYFGAYIQSYTDSLDLAIVKNGIIYGFILLLPMFILVLLVFYATQSILKSTSKLQINNGFLELTLFYRKKWSVPVKLITEIDSVQGQKLTKADIIRSLLSSSRNGNEDIGFSFKTGDKLYYVKPFVEDFDKLKEMLSAINPNIKEGLVSINHEHDLFFKKDISGYLINFVVIVVLIVGVLILINKLF